MPTPSEPQQEPPGTYFVSDHANQSELERLHIQDQMITAGMGGVLPEQPNAASFQRVLDVGCGSGGWLIEVAKTYPNIPLLIGGDINARMVAFARVQAEAAQVSNRVEFHRLDALQKLEFPTGFFDLVNQRLGQSYLRTWDWRKLLQEYKRITRPGGVIRVTETEWITDSNSPALMQIYQLSLQASFQAGHLFHVDCDGLTSQLPYLLRQHGLENVQTHIYTLEYRAGTPQGETFTRDMQYLFQTGLPFLRKWTQVPEDYESICQQALNEMQEPGFVATGRMLTAWGIAPSASEQ